MSPKIENYEYKKNGIQKFGQFCIFLRKILIKPRIQIFWDKRNLGYKNQG